METCLLNNLTYSEYKDASALPLHQCEVIATLADVKIQFDDSSKPGEQLIKMLNRLGYSAQQYKDLLKNAQSTKMIRAYYKPQTKVAVLIANDRYVHLSKLVTPSLDCDSLRSNLRNLGFIVVTVKNSLSTDLRSMLERIFEAVPEKSYCLIFYAGHGCELCNIRCMLDITCPVEDITMRHCVTENFILKVVSKCKPELCVLFMDMCRVKLERNSNAEMYDSVSLVEPFDIEHISNLLISYSTQSMQSAYEICQIECSSTLDDEVTYELQTGDSDRILPVASQYVNALCTRMVDDLDVSALLDKVHADVENSLRKQRPIKIQCGVAKRSLYDPVKGDSEELLNKLVVIGKDYDNTYFHVF